MEKGKTPDLLTVQEVAALFGKSDKTIRRWIASGKLKAEKNPGGRDWIVIVDDKIKKFSYTQ